MNSIQPTNNLLQSAPDHQSEALAAEQPIPAHRIAEIHHQLQRERQRLHRIETAVGALVQTAQCQKATTQMQPSQAEGAKADGKASEKFKERIITSQTPKKRLQRLLETLRNATPETTQSGRVATKYMQQSNL